MIRNWGRHNLNTDFSNIKVPKGHPSDVDMFYVTPNNTLILGEIKNEVNISEFKHQRWLYEKFCDFWKYKAFTLLIVHNKFVEDGDTEVDIASCKVIYYYYNHKWYKTRTNPTVQEIFDYILKEENNVRMF